MPANLGAGGSLPLRSETIYLMEYCHYHDINNWLLLLKIMAIMMLRVNILAYHDLFRKKKKKKKNC